MRDIHNTGIDLAELGGCPCFRIIHENELIQIHIWHVIKNYAAALGSVVLLALIRVSMSQ